MDSLEADDLFKIVNRSTEHHISKQIIRKVPYFEKLLSHECLESRENKVELDFDEQAFKLFLNWIEFDHLLIEMKNVINICTMIDYFGMDNNLINDYSTYFHDNFSIRHLPVVIPQVTPSSKFINSDALNAFICRYFLKMAITTFWLNYPLETIEYICNKDLMIHSEMQVFNAIMKWVNFKPDSRKDYLQRLLKLIRWCHLEDQDLYKIKNNEFVKSFDFQPEFCAFDRKNCGRTRNRTKQSYFIVIEQFNATDLRVKILESNFLTLLDTVVQPDESMPLDLLHNEHVSDMFIDSGRKGIRIDWKQVKYRILEYESHYVKIRKCLFEDEKTKILELGNWCASSAECSILEAKDEFIVVRNFADVFACYCHTCSTNRKIKSDFFEPGKTYLATILDSSIYMIKNNFEFYQFNFAGKFEHKSKRIEILKYSNFNNLVLTSSQANDDRIIIIDRSTKALFCYNVKTAKWSSMGRINNCDNRSADSQKESDELLTFTSTFISMETIESSKNLN